ncbi:MAG: KTSC domain-containing protein [Synergistaceae bacterium]|nr:KTSC domain-containing protein [Synergistaceae bacterium]
MNNDNVEMIEVSSSNVGAIGYDEDSQTLFIRFLNNMMYIYKGVPIGEFEGLRNAPSIGSYLHRNIKNLFPYERIG